MNLRAVIGMVALTVLVGWSWRVSSYDFLANQGVPTMIDANHAISHYKVMVIDGETVITGSFNFTKAARPRMPRTC